MEEEVIERLRGRGLVGNIRWIKGEGWVLKLKQQKKKYDKAMQDSFKIQNYI